MSITTKAFRFALTAAALCAAGSTADAKPRRVVILDFDGPHQLADTGRSSVISMLGEQYDIVSTKRWEDAKNAAAVKNHGPAQWSQAAKAAGVDAVIEGYIQDEGRRKILNIVVYEATNGREFDTIPVRIDAKGLSTENSRQLQTALDGVLDWIDGGEPERAPLLPTIKPTKHFGPTTTFPPADDGGEVRSKPHGKVIDDEEPAAAPVRKPRPARTEDVDDTTEPAKPAVKAPKAAAEDATAATDEGHEKKPAEVATKEQTELERLFPPGTEGRPEAIGVHVDHKPEKTVRFMVDAGAYYGSRSLIMDAEPDANVTQFAGVTTKGLQVNAAIYPWPKKEVDGILSGIGFTGSLHHSVGSTVVFPNDPDNTIDEYLINQNGFELGVHYRQPLGSMLAIDGGAFYGQQTYEIVDASPNFEVPDTKYTYIGLGAHLDLAVTDRATIGFGARYFTVLDTGDLASVDWYGPADASGLGLEATFLIPLPSNLYVRGQLSYQKISIDLSGGGQITDDEGVTGGTDSIINGNVNLGIAF